MMETTVAKWLIAAGFKGVIAGTVSALMRPEPIAVVSEGYKRDARTRNAERGVFNLRVYVVREVAAEAGKIALAAEWACRRASWKAGDATCGWTLCGVDTTVPAFEGYDNSGRAVFAFAVRLTCERGNHG